jgi:UDP-N-acetylglucosamine 2-epimerase (non-hydrolysing)
MKSFTILNVVGCRPNFIKIAPLLSEMKRHPEIQPVLVHTGQHYDQSMSDVFFKDLEIPAPDFCLEVGSGSYAKQFAQIAERLEGVLQDVAPDLVLVVGDVTSTLAAALTAVSGGRPVAHVEAGLRSVDREMPEEINRVLTDALSDFLFATERGAVANLLREGKYEDQVFFTGNVMIDSLMNHSEAVHRSEILGQLGLTARQYAVLTLHRPSNVDNPQSLQSIAAGLLNIQDRIPLVFPVHPRTALRLQEFRAWEELLSQPGFLTVQPLGYLDFMKLMKESCFVITDSGGVQEETTALGIPCLTLRENTERPVTLTQGTNQLIGTSPDRMVASALKILRGEFSKVSQPEKWDGRASQRIVSTLLENTDGIRRLYRSVRERSSCLNTLKHPLLQRV